MVVSPGNPQVKTSLGASQEMTSSYVSHFQRDIILFVQVVGNSMFVYQWKYETTAISRGQHRHFSSFKIAAYIKA